MILVTCVAVSHLTDLTARCARSASAPPSVTSVVHLVVPPGYLCCLRHAPHCVVSLLRCRPLQSVHPALCGIFKCSAAPALRKNTCNHVSQNASCWPTFYPAHTYLACLFRKPLSIKERTLTFPVPECIRFWICSTINPRRILNAGPTPESSEVSSSKTDYRYLPSLFSLCLCHLILCRALRRSSDKEDNESAR